MNSESEFQKVGKKMPYSVPEGFFDQITGRTLVKARQREKIHRKTVLMWRLAAVAASVAVLFALGYLVLSPLPEKNCEQTAQQMPSMLQPEVISQSPKVTAESQPKEDFVPVITDKEEITVSPESEEINDVLSALSNDELLQLAILYKSDIFLEETENNLQ
ncbi:MAG: hypothetical protein LLG13_14770 [Bacteroidales bacterium]|nr:hypothetical protein [Bacteroidales bacterium]